MNLAQLTANNTRETCVPIAFTMCSMGCEQAIGPGPSFQPSQLRVGACRKTVADSISSWRKCVRMWSFEMLHMLNSNAKDFKPLHDHFPEGKWNRVRKNLEIAFCKLVFKFVLSTFLLMATILDLVPAQNLLARSLVLAARRLEQKTRESHPSGMAFLPAECATHSFSNTEATRELCRASNPERVFRDALVAQEIM